LSSTRIFVEFLSSLRAYSSHTSDQTRSKSFHILPKPLITNSLSFNNVIIDVDRTTKYTIDKPGIYKFDVVLTYIVVNMWK